MNAVRRLIAWATTIMCLLFLQNNVKEYRLGLITLVDQTVYKDT